jgi:hypothetical protein
MPWTFAHPAAVLPLRPLKRLPFGALAIGSIAPDIAYYFGRFDLAAAAHTLPGIVTLCLSIGLALIALVRVLHRRSLDCAPTHVMALTEKRLPIPQLNIPIDNRWGIGSVRGPVTRGPGDQRPKFYDRTV